MRNNISRKQLREFGWLIGFGLPIIIGWLIPAVAGHGFRVWTFFIGIFKYILDLPNFILRTRFSHPKIIYIVNSNDVITSFYKILQHQLFN